MNEQIIIKRTKTFEEQREHFMERLQDRYEIFITTEQYDKLCKPEGVFHGAFSKQRRKTIGWVFINEKKVWVLRDGEMNRLATCYPPAIEHSETEMIRACFSGVARATAFLVYRMYLKESKQVGKKKFNSVKDAALYFFTKTKFAPLHIEKYKYKSVRTIRIPIIIDNILKGESDFVELFVRRKKQPPIIAGTS